ncbi:MAG TPA: TolC family protein [Opitutaceae bacterium]|nr:TolC family protein [Opitutaceae bacterium]
MSRSAVFAALGLAAVFPSGCQTTSAKLERAERERLERVAVRPARDEMALPVLDADAAPAEYVRYALLKHPAVFAAYSEWRAAAADIGPAGALPDPQLTFQADVTSMVMSLMPGVMFDLMLPGKRAAMARDMAASSEVAHREYLATVVRVAAEVRRAWIELAFVDEAIRLRERSLGSLGESADLASAAYATGMGMGATLDAQIKVANDTARIRSELASLADRRRAAQVQFKAALGLAPTDADPAWPRFPLVATALPNEGELWSGVVAANPELGKMRAMVEMAVAGEEVARQKRWPDFTAGLMADVKPAPWMWRPTATATLPVWRRKIAGQIEAARARRDAAAARVDAEVLTMAAEFARMLYMVRESDRMIAFIDTTALPNLERTLATSAAAFQSGAAGPAMIPETELMVFAMRAERLDALRERELAATGLLAMSAAVVGDTGFPGLEAALTANP